MSIGNILLKSKFVEGIFLSRENRFIGYIDVNGSEVIAHIPNTGRCKELLISGVKVFLEEKNSPTRKTKYTLHYVENKGVLVNMISITGNNATYNALLENRIEDIKFPRDIKREVKYENSRFDLFCISKVGNCDFKTYIEVKGVTLIKDGYLQFPDAPTARGAKHIEELIKLKKMGFRAVVIFVAQHPLGNEFKINREGDLTFYKAFKKAKSLGVEFYVYRASEKLGEYNLTKKLKLIDN